jgi:hypothetical protein
MFSKRVHVLLIGGLGNQLFQLAAGLYLNEHCGLKTKFNSAWFMSPQRFRRMGMTPRRMLMGELLREGERSSLSQRQIRVAFLFSRFVRSLTVIEADADDTPLERVSVRTIILSGYFQKSRYVKSVQGSLIQRMKESNEFSPLVPNQLEPRIAIHMRLGDYVDNVSAKAFHGLTSVQYYVTAAHQMIQETGLNHILIVSDEPQNAYKIFTSAFDKGGIEISYIDNSTEMNDLALLSHSAGIIISNSSFSWWAAWLGSTNLGAKVIAPTPWFAQPSTADSNLHVSAWTYLHRELS